MSTGDCVRRYRVALETRDATWGPEVRLAHVFVEEPVRPTPDHVLFDRGPLCRADLGDVEIQDDLSWDDVAPERRHLACDLWFREARVHLGG